MHHFLQLVLWGTVILFLPLLSFAEDIKLVNQEIIKDGGFEANNDDWILFGTGRTTNERKNGTYSMTMFEYACENQNSAFQMLPIPSELSAARLKFDYNVTKREFESFPAPVVFLVNFLKLSKYGEEDEPLGKQPAVSIDINESSDWQTVTVDLDQDLIDKINTAHKEGAYIYILLGQRKTGPDEIDGYTTGHGFQANIDNFSLKIDGIQHIPEMPGKIAYLNGPEGGEVNSINLLTPDTREITTIWNDSALLQFDLAWSPDASRLAFVSGWDDRAGNVYINNIFSIRPDGSELKQIPDTPTIEELESDAYPRVTLNGTLKIDTDNEGLSYPAQMSYQIYVFVQGTDRYTIIPSCSPGESVPFTIFDVPVTGDGILFNQNIFMRWTRYTNTSVYSNSGTDTWFPSEMLATGSNFITFPNFNLGEIDFEPAHSVSGLIFASPEDISWKYDGKEIGFKWNSILLKTTVDAKYDNMDFIKPSRIDNSSMVWSPVDDRYLFIGDGDTLGAYNSNIFLAREGDDSPRLLVENVKGVQPAWLPDGSGFIYIVDTLGKMEGSICELGSKDIICEYDLTSGQSKYLAWFPYSSIYNISVSPDGRYIVFERKSGSSYDKNKLWVMDRKLPVEMWQVTDTGNCRNPAWSPGEPVVIDDAPEDGFPEDQEPEQNPDADTPGDELSEDETPEGEENDGGSNDSGNGCFITTMRD